MLLLKTGDKMRHKEYEHAIISSRPAKELWGEQGPDRGQLHS
jgi:hypothetical protein